VLRILEANADLAKRAVGETAVRVAEERNCSCRTALEHAIITDRASIPPERLEMLAVIVGRALGLTHASGTGGAR
jgi:hypothetical protein